VDGGLGTAMARCPPAAILGADIEHNQPAALGHVGPKTAALETFSPKTPACEADAQQTAVPDIFAPEVVAFETVVQWPPNARQLDLWAVSGIGPARIAVME